MNQARRSGTANRQEARAAAEKLFDACWSGAEGLGWTTAHVLDAVRDEAERRDSDIDDIDTMFVTYVDWLVERYGRDAVLLAIKSMPLAEIERTAGTA